MERRQWIVVLGIVFFLCLLTAGVGSIVLTRVLPNLGGAAPAPAAPVPTARPGEPTFTPAPAAPTTQPPAQQPPAQPGPGTKARNVLTILGTDPPTLDPHLTTDATSAEYIVEIFSGLVTISPDLDIVPDLAESWEISPDGTVYTFRLRDDATFHDGRPVTAEDFKWSLERAADPGTFSPVADTYLGDIVGVKEKLGGRSEEIQGVRVIDDRTLEITIDGPKTFFLAKLTYPTAFVLDRENVEGGGPIWFENPNGTGPFMLEEYSIAQRLTLVPNPNYHGQPKPGVEAVEYLLAGGSAMTLYETDEIDMTGVGLADLERVQDPNNPLNQELEVVTTLSTFYVGLNAGIPPFDDVKVRQAFVMALDRERLNQVVLLGAVEPAQGILPPEMPCYNPDLQTLPYDPDRAQQLLAESKYAGDLPEVTLHISSAGGAAPRTVEAMLEMWRTNLGVDVAIEQTEFSTFLQDIQRDPNPYPMFNLGWIADYPDPQNFLDLLFHGESSQNHTGYDNPRVNELLEEARTLEDEARRCQIYREVEEIIVEEAPWIPLSHGKEYWLSKPYVEGQFFPPLVIPRLKFISINTGR